MAKQSSFKEGSVHFLFYNAFIRSFEGGLQNLDDILNGRADYKDDSIKVKAASAVSGQLGAVPVLGTYLGIVAQAGIAAYSYYREGQAEQKSTRFLSSIYSFSEEYKRLRVNYIAAQVTYRWCSWLDRFDSSKPDQVKEICRFGGLAAVRMLAHALELNQYTLTDTEALLAGIVKAKTGAGHNKVRNTPFETLQNHSGKCTYTMEGAFSEPGLWVVDYVPVGMLARQKLTKINKKESSVKYGYIQVNNRSLEHFEEVIEQKNSLLSASGLGLNALSYRYATKNEVAQYLQTNCSKPFSEWVLAKDGGTPQNASKTCVIIAGEGTTFEFDERKLDGPFKNFARGDFSGIDFSGCIFKGVTLGNCQGAILRFCQFEQVIATHEALIRSAFGGSQFSRCDFKGLDLFQIEFAHCRFVACDFFGAKRTSNLETDQASAQIDEITRKTMDQNLLEFASRSDTELLRQAEVTKRLEEDRIRIGRIEEMQSDQSRSFEKIHFKSDETNQVVKTVVESTNRKFDSVGQEATRAAEERAKMKLRLDTLEAATSKNLQTKTQESGEEKELMPAENVKELPTTVEIVYSGKDGFRGRDGLGYGQSGTDGTRGEAAHQIQRTISINKRTGVVVIQNRNAEYGSADYLPLGNPEGRIIMQANGGKGGDGGHGFAGQDGRDGLPGRDATQSSVGTDGTRGGDGTVGGNGGRAGEGGDAATIEITVPDPRDTDALMYIDLDQLSCKEGKGGAKGRPGLGGRAGLGGRGGSELTWREYDSDKSAYVTRHNRKGNDGEPGLPGPNGHHTDADGLDGRGARTRWAIGLVGKVYNDIYRVDIDRELQPRVVVDDELSRDEFIEPGQRGFVEEMVVINRGDMPSPEELMSISINPELTDSAIVSYEGSVLQVQSSIEKNRPIKVPGKIQFSVADADRFLFPPNHRLCREAKWGYDFRMERVQRSFLPVKNFRSEIIIQYPLSLSTVSQSSRLMTPNGQLFFSIILFNRSNSKHYGTLSQFNPRMVWITFSRENHLADDALSLVALHNKQQHGPSSLDKRFTLPIDQISPRNATHFAGCISVDPLKVKGDEDYRFSAKLWIGPAESKRPEGQVGPGDEPEERQLIAIQQMDLRFRLALPYVFNPKALFVLVINEATPQSLIQAWLIFAQKFETTVSVWNSTLYDGFGYEQSRVADGGSFYQELRERVVIVFNNASQHNFRPHTQIRALDKVGSQEIYVAARYGNVRTYVISDQSNCYNLLHDFSEVPLAESKQFVQKQATGKLDPAKHFRFFENPKTLWASTVMDDEIMLAPSAPSHVLIGHKLALEGLSDQKSQNMGGSYQPLALTRTEVVRNADCCGAFCCDGGLPPTGAELTKIAKSAGDKLTETYPNRVYKPIVVQDHDKIASGYLYDTYSIGRIELYRSINATDPRVAVTHTADEGGFKNIRPRDEFAVLKLLPFYMKLSFIKQAILSNHSANNMLRLTLLSDLTDEIIVFIDSQLSSSKMRPRLDKFNQLFDIDQKIAQNPICYEFIHQMLVHLELIAVKKDPQVPVTRLVEKIVKELKLKFLDQSKKAKSEFNRMRKELKSEFGSGNDLQRSHAILRHHSRPFEPGSGRLTHFNTDASYLKIVRRVDSFEAKELKASSDARVPVSFSDNNCNFWRYGSEEQQRMKRQEHSLVQPGHYGEQSERVEACLQECDIDGVPTSGLMLLGR